MTRSLLLVGLGGGIGSMVRFAVSRMMAIQASQGFPWATFCVNLVGSLLIGLVWGWGTRGLVTDNWKLFLITGLLGGFTTFSAFSLENIMLLQQQRYITFFLYAGGSVLLCLLAAWAGIRISGQ